MSKPESRGPRRAPLFKSQLNAFFFFIGGTGAAMAVAHRAQLRRSTFHPKRQEDDSFSKRWAWVLDFDLQCTNTRKERPAMAFPHLPAARAPPGHRGCRDAPGPTLDKERMMDGSSAFESRVRASMLHGLPKLQKLLRGRPAGGGPQAWSWRAKPNTAHNFEQL